MSISWVRNKKKGKESIRVGWGKIKRQEDREGEHEKEGETWGVICIVRYKEVEIYIYI